MSRDKDSRRKRMRWPLVFPLLAALLWASPASANPPYIAAPHNTEEVPLSFQGPVEVLWGEAGEMKLEVTGPGYAFLLAPITITPEEVGSAFQYTIDPLPAYGSYTITAAHVDGSESDSNSVIVPPPNDALVLSPADGGTVLDGWQGPLRIRWDSIAHPQAYYIVGVDSTGACVYEGRELARGEVTSCTLWWVPDLGPHTIAVEEVGVETFLLSSFEVEPRLSVAILSVTPYRFYPYVRDGYRDRTALTFDLNKVADVVVRVRNSSGRAVRSDFLGEVHDGTWSWNGRNGAGSLVPTSRYRVVIEARAHGELRRASREVIVARGWVTKQAAKERCGGCGSGVFDHSASCSVTFDEYYDGDVFLDCWGGPYAVATWRFRVPATAFDIRKTIVGKVLCCAPGSVASRGERTGPRTYRVGAGVSGRRAWDIRRIRISYSYKVRI